jgi:hypothetical protein
LIFYFCTIDHQKLNKAISISLLLILLLQTGGMLMVYKIQQFSVQYKMSRAMNNNEASFEKLIFNLDEYYKCRLNSREISYNGDLYDVKSVKFCGAIAELLVLKDERETALLEEIKAFLHKSNQSKKELPDHLQKLLSINYIAADEGRLIYIPSLDYNIFYQPESNLVSDFIDNPSPPPKFY